MYREQPLAARTGGNMYRCLERIGIFLKSKGGFTAFKKLAENILEILFYNLECIEEFFSCSGIYTCNRCPQIFFGLV